MNLKAPIHRHHRRRPAKVQGHNRLKAILRTATRMVLPRLRPCRSKDKRVAVVVPMSQRTALYPDERISLRHLFHHLGRYDKFLVLPEGTTPDLPGFAHKRFPGKFFGSAGAHARLLYDARFYAAFREYEFILFYHLDSLVLSDELEKWCATGIDYVGPPWIKCPDSPWVWKNRVGNCGFALLRIESALEVLHARHLAHPSTYWLDRFARNGDRFRPLIRMMRSLPRNTALSRAAGRLVKEWEIMQDPGPNNRATDLFWSDQASQLCPGFRVATFEQGLRFGFEVAPRLCLEMNGGSLPFGCHAWNRYDRQFWEPYLLATA